MVQDTITVISRLITLAVSRITYTVLVGT